MHFLPALPDTRLLFVLPALAGVLVFLRRLRWAAGFVLGFAWTSFAAGQALDARLPAQLDRHDVRVSGWVDDFPEAAPNRVRLSLTIDSADMPELAGSRVRLNWYDPTFMPGVGERMSVTARLRMPHGFVNPGGFDYERWLLLEGFAATGYIRTIHQRSTRPAGLGPWLLEQRADIRERIHARLPSKSAASLVTALAIGERSGFDDRNWEVFRRTGTSHLVAISGLHVGIVAMVVLWLSRRLLRFAGGMLLERSGGLAATAALVAAIVYAGLAGFSVSTLRAVAMLAVALLIAGSLRRVSRLHGLAAAALFILVIDPLATLGNSFWLSFGAVATLFIATAPHCVIPLSRFSHLSVSVVRVQLAITMVAIPVSAVFFGEFSLIALAVNLVAIPLFSLLLVPAVLVSVLLEVSLGAPQLLWQTIEWLAAAAMAALELAATLPFASLVVPAPGVGIAVLAIVGVLLMLPWNPQPGRAIGVLALTPLLWPRHDYLTHGAFRLTVLDVGHGLAVIVETQNSTLIYDAGPSYASGFDVGRDVVLPALSAKHAPDMLVISHGDNDHSGGAAAVMAAWPRISVLTGPDMDIVDAAHCSRGQRWTRDGVRFTVLHPADGFPVSRNDSSCVLRISGAAGSALLAGDIERAGEAALIADTALDVDVVVAPHHGSETSSGTAFVAATSPLAAVFSSAFGNRWGFPRAAVVDRWCAAGASVYVTGEQGAIDVTFSEGRVRTTALRLTAPRYWRANAGPRCGESSGGTL